jgi:hypothetical protein
MCSKQNVIIIFMSLLLLSSCAPVYIPTKNNVPLFSGKGEFQGFAGVGLGLNVQTAYAISDHIGIAANYLHSNNSEGGSGSTTMREHQAGEIAIGYYKNLKSDPDLCFEVFTGYGRGKGKAIDTDGLFTVDLLATGRYQKFFVQPAIGTNKNRFNWSVSLKCSIVDFTSIKVVNNDEEVMNTTAPKLFLAPAFTCAYRIWPKNLSATLQTGINAHVGSRTIYDYEFFMLSVGLLYKVSPKIKSVNP